jgi:hypothetical protein
MIRQPLVRACAAALAVGCQAPFSGSDVGSHPGSANGTAARPMAGVVDFGASRAVAVKISDFAAAATVSLIDPETGNTEATTLTDSEGQFVLTFRGAFQPGIGPYYLEAVKGLGPEGTANRAGWPLMRVRTIASLDAAWKSLNKGNLVTLNRSSTALSAIADLKGLDKARILALLESLEVNRASAAGELSSKDTFTATSEVSSVEYLQVNDLVNQALDQDVDPIGSLFLRLPGDTGPQVEKGIGYGMQPRFAWKGDGPVLHRLEPPVALVGSTVTIHGQGLPGDEASIAVSLGGKACAVLSAMASKVVIQVPVGATSGPLHIKVGKWTFSNLALAVLWTVAL